MPILYKGQQLTMEAGKSSGKNVNPVNGFYKNKKTGEQFFIKQPNDQGELFTELLAGLILREFIKRGLVEPHYHGSLICADVIKLENGTYGLIQPKISLKELHLIIGTTDYSGKDRSAAFETIQGPRYYRELLKLEKYFGLSVALMFSLLLGAQSVHSGNIVVLSDVKGALSNQFARIDWGDAFRYFGNPQNNEDVLNPYESQGTAAYKKLTKGYIFNYKSIGNIFPAIAQKASTLNEQLPEALLLDIVKAALSQIPADLLNNDTQTKLAKYMDMASLNPPTEEAPLAGTTFGEHGNYDQFAKDLSNIMSERLHKIAQLKDLEQSPHLYQSIIAHEALPLPHDTNLTFPELIQGWKDVLEKKSHGTGNLSLIQFDKLINSFNQFIERVAARYDDTVESTRTENLFAPYFKGDNQAKLGAAFIPQYREATVINRIFASLPDAPVTSRLAKFETPYEEYSLEHKDAPLTHIKEVLTYGGSIVGLLQRMKMASDLRCPEFIEESTDSLLMQLSKFLELEAQVNSTLQSSAKTGARGENESPFFYPIPAVELSNMTGDQLATIAFEELNHSKPYSLIERILSDIKLSSRMFSAISEGVFNGRQDDIKNKIIMLYEMNATVLSKMALSAEKDVAALQQLRFEIQQEREQFGAKIKALDQTIAGKNQEIAKLAHENKEHEDTNRAILEATADKTQSVELLAKIHAAEVKALNARIQELEKQTNDMQVIGDMIQQAQAQSDQLKKAMAAQEIETTGKIESLTRLIDEREQDIVTLLAELEQKETKISTLERAAQDHVNDKQSAELKVASLESQLINLNARAQELQQQLTTKSNPHMDEVALSHTIEEQKAKIADLTRELSSIRTAHDRLNQKYQSLERQSSEPVEASGTSSKELDIANATAQALREALAAEAATSDRLRKELDDANAMSRALKQTHAEVEKAEQQYKKALETKDLYYARKARLAPILVRIAHIEEKAQHLADRGHNDGAKAANMLAKNLRDEVENYAKGPATGEIDALKAFKAAAKNHVVVAGKELNQHREQWKYVLANISLAIMLLGVGYLVAGLMNKGMTGNFTFFSQTASGKQLDDLDNEIGGTRLGAKE